MRTEWEADPARLPARGADLTVPRPVRRGGGEGGGGGGACGQLCIPSWGGAVTPCTGGSFGKLPPARARSGSGACTRRAVMTAARLYGRHGPGADDRALHPHDPRAYTSRTPRCKRHSEHNPGSLAGPDRPDGLAAVRGARRAPGPQDLPKFHVRGPNEQLFEESMVWARR
ncbi:hypothetical protein Shyd_68700 [Streptomyces hydrogenans]|uniref:Uncharacterized protein n=1 Tax=Streptomyces hydrogenans TaxID=1873719 RepID=A0ABQ3PKF9_9ACTN|nr:hypothetical protein Shyd_68700 [Streptomyces hydrogenans]